MEIGEGVTFWLSAEPWSSKHLFKNCLDLLLSNFKLKVEYEGFKRFIFIYPPNTKTHSMKLL